MAWRKAHREAFNCRNLEYGLHTFERICGFRHWEIKGIRLFLSHFYWLLLFGGSGLFILFFQLVEAFFENVANGEQHILLIFSDVVKVSLQWLNSGLDDILVVVVVSDILMGQVGGKFLCLFRPLGEVQLVFLYERYHALNLDRMQVRSLFELFNTTQDLLNKLTSFARETISSLRSLESLDLFAGPDLVTCDSIQQLGRKLL